MRLDIECFGSQPMVWLKFEQNLIVSRECKKCIMFIFLMKSKDLMLMKLDTFYLVSRVIIPCRISVHLSTAFNYTLDQPEKRWTECVMTILSIRTCSNISLILQGGIGKHVFLLYQPYTSPYVNLTNKSFYRWHF